MLEPGGRLLLSVNHPVIRPVVYPQEDYLATTAYIEAHLRGRTAALTSWSHTLQSRDDANS